MPKRPPRRCVWAGCPEPIYYRGACKIHQPAPWTRGTPDPDRPKGRAWMKLKLSILERDNYTCYNCGGRAEQVDHVLSIGEGGARWSESNLAAICYPCHEAKSKAEAIRGAQRAREQRGKRT